MSLFKFEDFVFDSKTYRLNHRGSKVAIRPKTTQLLNFLIANRDRVVSKAEIIAAVWGSNHVRDYALFQLISELRKLPVDGECVRTQPNEGYQWIAVTSVIHDSYLKPALVAASVFVGIITILAITALSPPNKRLNDIARLPALDAFSKGVIALESGDSDKAIEWFEFALLENPESIESALFLAETLFQQNKLDASSQQLQSLLQQPNLSPYNAMTASDLMSRIRQHQGRLSDALTYAQRSARTDVNGHCSVDIVDQRIKMLKGVLGQKTEMSLEGDQLYTEEQDPSEISSSKQYIDRCNELKDNELKTQGKQDDSSACLPQNTYIHYAYARVVTQTHTA